MSQNAAGGTPLNRISSEGVFVSCAGHPSRVKTGEGRREGKGKGVKSSFAMLGRLSGPSGTKRKGKFHKLLIISIGNGSENLCCLTHRFKFDT